jgi:hypothetical protein
MRRETKLILVFSGVSIIIVSFIFLGILFFILKKNNYVFFWEEDYNKQPQRSVLTLENKPEQVITTIQNPIKKSLVTEISSCHSYNNFCCYKFNNSDVREICQGLEEVSSKGKSSQNLRYKIYKYLKDKGVNYRSIFIVGYNSALNGYEISKGSYDQRAILYSDMGERIIERGYRRVFLEYIGDKEIITLNGIKTIWPTYEENEVGRLLVEMYKAPSGSPTSEKAWEIVEALAMEED